MAIGTHRVFSFRFAPGEGSEPLPENGDFIVVKSTKPELEWSTYRVLQVKPTRDVVEPYCNGGHEDYDIPEGAMVRVLHFRIGVVRVEPGERPEDAMTWWIRMDKPSHRH
jgi:hypothetical protein